jgi:hypothetical protein
MPLIISDQIRQLIRSPGWLTARSTATAVMRIADPTAHDQDLGHRLRPHFKNGSAELSLTAPQVLVPTSETPRTTCSRELVAKPPRWEATRP